MRRRIAIALLCAGACGRAPGTGGLEATVSYALADASGGCVNLRVVPEGQAAIDTEVSLTGRARSGSVVVAIVRKPEWVAELTLIATLHRGTCASAPIATHTVGSQFPAAGVVAQVSLKVTDPMLMMGTGGGAGGGSAGGATAGGAGGGSAGGVAGGAAGGAAGGVAGGNAGGAAGGAAGGTAGGTAGGSAGGAAGGSAGGLATICDAGFHPVSTPLTGEIAELAVYGEGQLWVVALNGAVQVAQRQPNGTFLPPSGGCTSGYSAAFARSDGRVYLGGAFSGIERLNDAVGTCTAVDSVSTSAAMTGLIGFPAGSGTTELTAVHQDGTIAVRSDPAGTVTGVGPIDHAFAVDGLSSTALHVVGADNGSNKGRVFQGSGTSWSSGFTAPSNERLFAVSLATPSLGYAAGQGSLIRYDGNWNTFTALPVDLTQVRGLLAFPNGDVFAVGTSSKVFKYTASTSRWAPVADFGAGVTVLNKVRGTNECNLWVGGANGFVATTFTP